MNVMRKILLLALLLSFSLANVFSQCTETPQTKVMLIGDSWGFFMDYEQTLNNVFKKWGHSDIKYVTNSNIVVNGWETHDLLTPAAEQQMTSLFNQYPSINVVHMSIGGNDMLGDWKVSFSAGKTDSMMNDVRSRIDSIVMFLKAAKPGIRIVWSGYTYPNFDEIINTAPFPFNGSSHPYYSAWQKMEFPTNIQINTVLNDFSAKMVTYAAADPQVDFVNATGILQYTYGQTTPLGVPPGGTYPPYTVPLPEGDPNYPSPEVAMRDYLSLAKDCFHLSGPSYADFIGYQTQKFYQKFFMNDLYLLSENNTQTGTVSSQGNVSDSLFMGESNGEQFATVLSFNTTAMADTTLAKASIFISRNSLSGNNPISGNLDVKVKNGNFGTTVNVEAADFAAGADGEVTPCLFGSNTGNGDWIRLDLPSQVYPFINNSATTQFIISAPGFTGGKVNFNNSSDPDFAPVLNLTYGQVSGVANVKPNVFSVYPNPTNNIVNIKSNGEIITQLQVTDILGKTVLNPAVTNNSIDISSLPSGMYLLNISTKTGKATYKVFKD